MEDLEAGGRHADDERRDGDGNSSSSGTTTNLDSTSNATPGQDQTQATSEESSSLARAETQMVNRSKMLVLVVLTLAAVAVSMATYFLTRQSETQEFENKFHDITVDMDEQLHDEARRVFKTMANFATTITSHALGTSAAWPFVTVPNFEVRGLELNDLSQSLMVGFSPLVSKTEKEAWETYASSMQGWIREGITYNSELHSEWEGEVTQPDPISPSIFKYENSTASDFQQVPESGDGPYLPVWQLAPAPHVPSVVNYNMLSNEVIKTVYQGMNSTMSPCISHAFDLEFFYGGSIHHNVTDPHSILLAPVFDDFNSTHQQDPSHIVGVVMGILPWDHYFENILSRRMRGVYVVMESSCGDFLTYVVNGADASFVDYGDVHDSNYDHLEQSTRFDPFNQWNFSDNINLCDYNIHMYPSWQLEKEFRSSRPISYAVMVFLVFVATTLVFVLYDFYVTRRQNKVALAAKRSNAVVASLFPKNVRERMLKEAEEQILANEKAGVKGHLRLGNVPKSQLKNFLDDGIARAGGIAFDTKPIADLFPDTTIMFGDVCGFTAWSSVREPTQVFTLLETIYHAFDEIAKRRRVFKVETIGDCYVAVSGLPEPRKDHASVMARFARDCLCAMNDLTKRLEVTLGPDTGELSMRLGLHSGPVTAGVLRGDKSRFQLFGDTVNTASRIESTGQSNRIHISKETADLLKAQCKGHWVFPRKDKIQAKGKGYLETFWLDIKKQTSRSEASGKSGSSSEGEGKVHFDMPHLESLNKKVDHDSPAKLQRRVQWNVDVLCRLLKQVIARRNAERRYAEENDMVDFNPPIENNNARLNGTTVLDEVKEIIELPKFNAAAAKNEEDPSKVELPSEVLKQLHEYVSTIASLYHHDNPFHNFEHASHVTMSVTKLLSRIVAPEDVLTAEDDEDAVGQHLHDHTYGITSDPLTQFAVAFSALIHDVDHTGAPNAQLIKEDAKTARIYKNQSIAEQNSVDVSWQLLMDDSFQELRSSIYSSEEERKRFRQLVVNVVLATDICDKQLKELRNNRWEKAFHGKEIQSEEEAVAAINRKATIVLEHLIQASDVAHTMQHWHIYRRWNEALYHENMRAYREGRAEKDPTEFWYKGEMGFFDFYIIPLAKKLKDCGVFGVSSDEYLNYALSNRQEWEVQGQDVVTLMSRKYLPVLAEGQEEDEEAC